MFIIENLGKNAKLEEGNKNSSGHQPKRNALQPVIYRNFQTKRTDTTE